MGKHGVEHVPPKQYGKLKRQFPELSSREIRVKWARIQKATKGPNLNLKHKLVNKIGLKSNTNFVKTHTYPELTPAMPPYVFSYQDYHNPIPSTSTWPHDTVPYKSRDHQKLDSPIPKEPHRQDQIVNDSYEVEGSSDTSESYYSPETEPISPCRSGAEAPDILSHCMKEANLGSESVVGLPLVSAPVKPVAPVVPVAKVAPIPIEQVEPVEVPIEQVEPVEVPIVSPPVVYDVANDPDIEVLMEVEGPAPVESQPSEVADSENRAELEIVLEIPNPRQKQTQIKQRQKNYYKQKVRHQRREKK